MSTTQTMPARQRAAGHLSTKPTLALTRWFLATRTAVSEPVHEVLIKELDVSPPGIVIAFFNLVLFNIWCCWDTRAPVFITILVLNVVLCAIRYTACRAVLRTSSPRATDFYVLSSLVWFGLQGVLAGTAEFTGNGNLEVLGTACVLGLMGPLCARNFGAPHFGMGIILVLDLPYLAGCAASPSHELLAIVAFSPGFLYSCWHTIRRFQGLSMAAQVAKFTSDNQARHDPLTGALNRFGLQDVLESGNLTRLTFFHLDLDDFKQVNDRHGHHGGDIVLQQVTQRLKRHIPEDALVARLGGDEFAVVAPAIGPAKSAALAALLIEQISHPAYRIEGDVIIKIGVSIGYACAPEDTSQLSDLYRKADIALYAAKTHGKGAWRHVASAAYN